mgnify:FL=1
MNNGVKKTFKVLLKILLVIVIILVLAVVALAGTYFFINWQKDVQDKESGDKNIIERLVVPEKKEEPVVTCLFLGVNGNLTDFIMLGQYNPNTREIALLSIPRDTNIGNNSVDGKINSAYSSRGMDKLKKQVTEITDIEIDYHVLFKTKILRQVVDKIGGVTVDVPINMNYDDPYQNLYIHLKKGTQKLTGSQAEQFCRFRKNNDGSGYPGGDVERTKAQQKFIKAFIAELLKVDNVSKIPDLINIVLEGTKTNVTLDVAKEYIDDVIALKTDRITTNTLPGSARMGQSPLGYMTSYYYYDAEKTKTMIDEMFHSSSITSGETTVSVTSSNVIGKDESGELTVRVELLNAGTTSNVINNLVDKLRKENFYVVKIGNYDTSKKEASRIIDYGATSEDLLHDLMLVTGITKTETSSEESSVAYTIIVGPYYK